MIHKFYSKNFLLTLITGIIFLYVFGIFVSYRFIDLQNQQKHKHAIAQHQAALGKMSKEDRAIKNAQEYMTLNLHRIQPEQRLLLDYLQRKFDLNNTLSAKTSLFVIPEDPQAYPQEINFLARIAYPNNVVEASKPKSIVDGPLLTNIYSANCDRLPFPANYWQTMEENYSAGGYSLTHSALAFAFMKDNGCVIPAERQDLVGKVMLGMAQIAADKNSIADLRYEAIALLLLNSKYDMVEQSWIDEIVSSQLSDGSWSEEKKGTIPSDHATVLATWALLEYSRPNLPYEPIIHHPSE